MRDIKASQQRNVHLFPGYCQLTWGIEPGFELGIADKGGVLHNCGVVAGLYVAATVFEWLDARTQVEIVAKDGARVARGERLATVSGPTRALVAACSSA